jgi:hypothetical protein
MSDHATDDLSGSARTAAVIEAYCVKNELPCEKTVTPDTNNTTYVVVLPGTHKLMTNVALSIGKHSLTINAFVARNPDENHKGVYAWLLERNRRMYAVAFSIDQFGDIYLTGKVPNENLSEAELDRIFGAVLEYSDNSFNIILELGFETAIRKEWAWRIKAGESTDNLAAFAHLATVRDSD